MLMRKHMRHVFVLCVKDDDCEDLEKRKVYRVIPDKKADKDGYIRVVDESGEDYLYPAPYSFASNCLTRRAGYRSCDK